MFTTRFSEKSVTIEQGAALLKAGDIEKAAMVFGSITAKQKQNVPALFMLGICHYKLQQYQKAESAFLNVIKTRNDHPQAHYYLGLTLERQNKQREANLSYQKALSFKPDFEEARKKLELIEKSEHSDTFTKARLSQELAMQQSDQPQGALIFQGHRRMSSFSVSYIFMLAAYAVAVWNLLIVSPQDVSVFFFSLLWGTFFFIVVFVNSRSVKYEIYENRIDYSTGVFFKETNSLWMYQIEQTSLSRSVFDLITGNATIQIQCGASTVKYGGLFYYVIYGLNALLEMLTFGFISFRVIFNRLDQLAQGPSIIKISGLGNYYMTKTTWEWIRDRSLGQRRAYKQHLMS